MAETPLLDTTKAVQAVNVSGEMQQSIPLGAQKHWSEFLRFVPGAVSRDATVNQAPVFYIHGAGIVSSSTLIDGADMTSAINPWAGYGALPEDTIADVQIKTSGLDAAAPLGMGFSANVVTRSGTNELKGSGTFTLSPEAWISNNVPNGTAESASIVMPEVSLGGPLLRDRWWFFGSYRYRSGTFGIGRPADQVADMEVLDPSFDPFDNEIDAHIFFTKVTARLNPSHELSAFFNRDATPYESNTTFNTGRFVRTDIGGEGYSARLSSTWGSQLTSRIAFSWNNKAAITELVNPGPTSRPVFRTAFLSAGTLVGATQRATLDNVGSVTENPYSKWTITGDLTCVSSPVDRVARVPGRRLPAAAHDARRLDRLRERRVLARGAGVSRREQPGRRDRPVPPPHLRRRFRRPRAAATLPTTRSTCRTRGGRCRASRSTPACGSIM